MPYTTHDEISTTRTHASRGIFRDNTFQKAPTRCIEAPSITNTPNSEVRRCGADIRVPVHRSGLGVSATRI